MDASLLPIDPRSVAEAAGRRFVFAVRTRRDPDKSNLATNGIPMRVLANLAGHHSIAVTQKYIDVNDDMLRNAVELI